MPKELLVRKRREPCLGDMRDLIKIHDREIGTPNFGDANFSENFSSTKKVWASVKTVSGQTFFTAANVDVGLSHEIIVRYDAAITSESWIELNGNNLKIISVEDLDNRHDFLRLRCTDRGDKDLGAAQA